jgi:hypothetical protein
VRIDVVEPLKMLTLSATIPRLSILKIRAAVVEVTQVTISISEPIPQILHLVRQAPFILPDTAFSSHLHFNGLHGAAQGRRVHPRCLNETLTVLHRIEKRLPSRRGVLSLGVRRHRTTRSVLVSQGVRYAPAPTTGKRGRSIISR